MEKYKYKALNAKGRPIKGVLAAVNENDLLNQLQTAGLELVSCTPLADKTTKGGLFGKKVVIRDLIQLFMHLDQMEGAGIPLLDSLADIRDTTDNHTLRDMMSEIYRDVSEGATLSEAMGKHPKVFTNLYVSLVAAGEETGKMTASYKQLMKYMKWVDEMQTRVRKATRYPIILLVVVVLAVSIMMGLVVPQIVGFIRNMDMELPFATTALIATSDFFQNYWWLVLLTPVVIVSTFFFLRRASEGFRYHIDRMILASPLMGPLMQKINIARFCQTFGALYSSGLPILASIKSATNTVDNLAMIEALENIQTLVKTGSTLSQAFNGSGEFPTMVVRMLKVGEESGNLTVVLDQVSEFYTKDVDEEVQKLIAMIEPTLTMVLGGMILWIAVGVFGPIYSSFENMDF